MKTCLLVQPGPFGDIIICAPIAKFYADQGFEVWWPSSVKFKGLIESLPYVRWGKIPTEKLHDDWLRSDVMHILKTTDRYSTVVNLADRGPHSTAQRPGENFEQCKYRIAGVPFKEKHKLVWSRDEGKEDDIESMFAPKEDYAFVHNTSSDGEILSLPEIELPIVYNHAPPGYTIFDWYKVLKNAKEIYCTESSIHCFCDGIVSDLVKKLYLLPRKNGNGKLLTISSFWDLTHFYK